MRTPHDSNVPRHVVGRALSGKAAHVSSATVFSGVDAKAAGARPGNAPHSLFQIVNHLVYWQQWVLNWLDGKKPRLPKHAAASWPSHTAPANAAEWRQSVRQYQTGLKELTRRAGSVDLLEVLGKQSRLEMLHAIASHNSYHLGQAVTLRQMLGKWPPRSGGVTW